MSIGVYHLSGIDLDCTVNDVIHHCKKKGILATACFMLKRRALHTTQTAKLYVRDDLKILEDGFWPDFLKCRPWQQSPPERVVSAPLPKNGQEEANECMLMSNNNYI